MEYIQKEDNPIDLHPKIVIHTMKKKEEYVEQVPCQGIVRSKEFKIGNGKFMTCVNTVSKAKGLSCGICFKEMFLCYHHKKKTYGSRTPQHCKNCNVFMGCVECLKNSVSCMKCGGRLCWNCRGGQQREGTLVQFHRCFVNNEIETRFDTSRQN